MKIYLINGNIISLGMLHLTDTYQYLKVRTIYIGCKFYCRIWLDEIGIKGRKETNSKWWPQNYI